MSLVCKVHEEKIKVEPPVILFFTLATVDRLLTVAAAAGSLSFCDYLATEKGSS